MMTTMRASGDLTSIQVMSQRLVLTDPIRPSERSFSIATKIAARCLTMERCSFTNDGIRQRRAQPIHWSRFRRLRRGQLEDQAEGFVNAN